MDTLTIHNLDHHPTRPFTEFIDLQGDFKAYVHLDRLADRIRQSGFKYDFLVWEAPASVSHQGVTYPAGTPFIVDAHARKQALGMLAAQGLEIQPVPYTRIFAQTLAEAEEELLYLNSRYGEIQPDSEFVSRVLSTMPDFSMLAIPEFSELPQFDDRPIIDFVQDGFEDDDDAGRDGAAGPSADDAQHMALAIILTPQEYRDWCAWKAEIGIKTDTKAFLELFTNR